MAQHICLDMNQDSVVQTRECWIKEVDAKFNKEKIPKRKPPEKMQEKKIEKPICKVPPSIRGKLADPDYAPKKVSFGPYHHKDKSCELTENNKEKVLFHSLTRTGKTIRDYAEPFTAELLKKLRDEYHELDPMWHSETAFLKLMVYDGCFLLEILHSANYGSRDDDSDNPVWDIGGIDHRHLMEHYRRDMLLLENQLPMLVLKKLRDVQGDKSRNSIFEKIQKVGEQEEYLNEHILKFIFPGVNIKIPPKKCLHVLDLYRHSLLSLELKEESKVQCLFQSGIISIPARVFLFLLALVAWVILALVRIVIFPLKLLIYILKTPPATEFPFNIPSATELDKAGIGFTSRTKGLRDISYGRGTLRLPQIYIGGATTSTFRNIIAFEQCYKHANKEVTSYIYFMHSLIHGAADVRLLQSRGAFLSRHKIGDKLVEWLNSLPTEVLHDPDSFVDSRYLDVSARLTNSYYRMSNAWQQELWQTYLRSPWAFVSLFAAFLLFALASVQTVYTVLGFYKSK